MMDWQTLSAISIVMLAAGVLLRQLLRFVSASAPRGCGSCPANHSATGAKSLPLVQIGGNLHSSSQNGNSTNASGR